MALFNRVAFIVVHTLMLCGYGRSQTVQATDTSLVMEVPGVSLTLKSTGCGPAAGNRSGSMSVVATMYDLQHASDTLVVNSGIMSFSF